MAKTTIAYIGLGSNLEQPVDQVTRALGELEGMHDTTLLARSSLYRSPPLGPADQPDYINAVAKLATDLSAPQLLAELFSIERSHGRHREQNEKWGPRSLDLDLLLYDDLVSNDLKLTLPHPGITERVFVLIPLLEIDPEVVVPGHGSAARLLAALGDQTIEKLRDDT